MTHTSESAPETAHAERLMSLDPAFVRVRANVFSEIVDDKSRRDEEILEALREGLRDMDPEIRADAAEALGYLQHLDAAPLLREAIDDDDGEVRTHAAVALIRLGEDAVFPAVVRALRHRDPRVVIGAAVVLGHLRDRRVVPNLVEAFKTDQEEVGAAVAWALGQCQDSACIPWLQTAVEQGFATANACEALGHIGDVVAFETLRGALHDAREEVRAYAARALGKLNYGSAATPEPIRNQAIETLRGRLLDDSRKVRLCAALSLFDLGASDSKAALVSASALPPDAAS